MFTADRKKLGALAAPRWLTGIAAVVAILIIALNIKLMADFVLS